MRYSSQLALYQDLSTTVEKALRRIARDQTVHQPRRESCQLSLSALTLSDAVL
jgi:hypothetical protein